MMLNMNTVSVSLFCSADYGQWVNVIQAAIIAHSKQSKGSLGRGMLRGGNMCSPTKEGYILFNENKRYAAVKGGMMCYYQSEGVSWSCDPSNPTVDCYLCLA